MRVALAAPTGGSRPARAARRPAFSAAAPLAVPWNSIGSTICDPTVFTGLSAFIAPWKIIAMSVQRYGRIESSPPARMSSPFDRDAPGDLRVRRQQPHQREQRRRLAAAGLADQPEPLALVQVEAHPLHRVQPPAVRQVEPDVEVARPPAGSSRGPPRPTRRCAEPPAVIDRCATRRRGFSASSIA